VDAAVKRFQARHGLPSDGVLGKYSYAAMNVGVQVRLGQLQTNLGRLRERVGTLGDRYVLVNIPAMQVEAVENGRVVLRHAAIVGKVDRQTPIVNSKINEIIVNPYWNAPVSIVRKDIIPLMRKNPNYLKDSHIRLFAPDGKEVDPMTIDWSTDDAAKYRFRQDPGANNAMATVKINFPSPDGVYMHDTPQQSLFGQLMRFDSSGCVRVQNVRDLVTWILRDTPGWDRQHFEAAIKTGESQPVAVTNPVPVHFLYITAWSTGPGVVQFRDDVYGWDGVDELQITSAL
jgi:murein L,D-transpeptidase YcbB/YkuD